MRSALLSVFVIPLFVATVAGGDVEVRAPGVHVQVTKNAQPILPPPLPLPNPGDPPPVPINPPVVPIPPVVPSVNPVFIKPLTLDEFARSFKAAPHPAKYEVFFVHPCTCQPVKVCFSLPGCPRRMLVRKDQIVFRYGLCKAVSITFNRNGTVSVRD